MKKIMSVFGLVAAVSLTSLFYVAPAQAGCHSWDVVCREARAARQAVAAAAAAAEAAAKHTAEVAAAAAKHTAEVVAAAAKQAAAANTAVLKGHGVGLAKIIADGSAKELEAISKMVNSLSPVGICEKSVTLVVEGAAGLACGVVAEAAVAELCVIATSPEYEAVNQPYCTEMSSITIPSLMVAGLSGCLSIDATGTSEKFVGDWANTVAQHACKIIPR
jgi:hypothetical protein